MKKLFLLIFVLFFSCGFCFASEGISFVYINGSNNNDKKMEDWYVNGVNKLHPAMKKEFEKNVMTRKYFLKDGKYSINKKPNIFFWGYKSHDDLNFVEQNLAITKSFSTWLAYQIRSAMTRFLHDAIWVQKYHNMAPILADLHQSVKDEVKSGNRVVLLGYSAGSFITYEYLQSRLTFIDPAHFFKKVGIAAEEMDFVVQHPMKKTCMAAIGNSKLAAFTASGQFVLNPNPEMFKENYLLLDKSTEELCIPEGSVMGIINFASPLVLFYSDISDPNFDLTYYNGLLYKYIIENGMFWLTVNYRADPLGFPGGRNLTIGEMAKITNLEIKPGSGFIHDQSDSWGRNSAFATHTSYWHTCYIFSRAVVKAYINGYNHQYDDNLKLKTINKYHKKYNIFP